jgi:hypothetical protein
MARRTASHFIAEIPESSGQVLGGRGPTSQIRILAAAWLVRSSVMAPPWPRAAQGSCEEVSVPLGFIVESWVSGGRFRP